MAEAPRLKEQLAEPALRMIAGQLARQLPAFETQRFLEQCLDGLQGLELKARVAHIAAMLQQHLPADFNHSARLLQQLAARWPRQSDAGWLSFAAWPLIEYAGLAGRQHPALALDCFEQLTGLFSAEFAIRPYVEQHFELVYPRLLLWTQHADPHVRRLASEAIRPRLPWAGHLRQLQRDPQPVLHLLELLKDDPAVYVQKSVANNLNDISKDHPQQVLALCGRWQASATPQRQWIIRHGLRSLIKQGQPEVFPLLGYARQPALRSQLLLSQSQVQLDQPFDLQVSVQSDSQTNQQLLLDYCVWHVKANGSRSKKVYKWKTLNLQAGALVEMHKQHAFKPLSTRKYYPGLHLLELLINGQVAGRAEIELLLD